MKENENMDEKLDRALRDLLIWAVGNAKDPKVGNPYCMKAVSNAMKVLAEKDGIETEFYLDVDFREEDSLIELCSGFVKGKQ